MVSYTLAHACTNTGQAQPDRRGRHAPDINKSTEIVEGVREHIKSFPTMESHYARKNTSKRYLDANLNLRKMYHLYTDVCTTNKTECVSERLYGKIFRDEFNLSFHHPKKDECNFCTRYRNSSVRKSCVGRCI